ncbi:MAG: hypothetical protein ABF295_12395 [Flavobacteriaceae bacterium]
MYKLTSLLFLLILFISCNSGGSNINPDSRSIQEGQNAYFSMDHKVAYSVFNNVYKDSAQTLEDRSLAGSYLAKMDWLFYRKNARAHKILDSLEFFGHNLARIHLLRSRILADELRPDEAIASAELAIEQNTSDTEKYHALLAYCSHVFTKGKEQVLAGKAQSSADSLELQKAYTLIQELAGDNSGDVAVAKLYLGYALLFKHGPEAFEAWMSYYRLTDINQVHSSLLESADTFKTSLDRYTEGQIDDSDADVIIIGLAESGFYELAVLVKHIQYGDQPHSDPFIKEIVFYHEFLQELEAVTQDFYLETIAGGESKNDYKKAVAKAAEVLWEKLSWTGDPITFSEEIFRREIRKRFKAVLKFIKANGYYGLHMGHVILDDRKMITQYKESAEFRYVAIDHMVSNGYSGWFWDGEAQTGGWADDDESFLQVRSAYTAGPIRSWQAVTDSIEIAKTKKNIGELAIADDSIAATDPYAYLPGLSERINFNEKKALLDSLTNMDLDSSALRLKFINTLERLVVESSIYAHEGRHAIDKKNDYASGSEELEYRAKLSEIYFAENPMLAFNAILSRNIGDGTSHGNANLRVVEGLVEWIESNKATIADFDTARPALPQIDKLSDKQIKSAIRQIDPMAK